MRLIILHQIKLKKKMQILNKIKNHEQNKYLLLDKYDNYAYNEYGTCYLNFNKSNLGKKLNKKISDCFFNNNLDNIEQI